MTVVNLLLTFALAWAGVAVLRARKQKSSSHLPTVGSDLLFGYVSVFRSLTGMPTYLMEGYTKYGGAPFEVRTLRGREVFVAGKYIQEVCNVPNEDLSNIAEIVEIVDFDSLVGPAAAANPYHVPVLRKKLNPNLSDLFPRIHGHIEAHLKRSSILMSSEDWSPVLLPTLALELVSGVTIEVLLGQSLCDDPAYLHLAAKDTESMFGYGFLLARMPHILRSFVARCFTPIRRIQKLFHSFLVPIIRDRQVAAEKYGSSWDERPWLLDHGEETDLHELSLRVLNLNLTAIHTTTSALTHALLDLAARPDVAEILREEVEQVVKEYGWTK